MHERHVVRLEPLLHRPSEMGSHRYVEAAAAQATGKSNDRLLGAATLEVRDQLQDLRSFGRAHAVSPPRGTSR